MPARANLEAYGCATGYFHKRPLDDLRLSVRGLSAIEMQSYLLTMPYKCGLAMFLDAVASNSADALPNEAFEGVALVHLIDYLDIHGTGPEKAEARKRIDSQARNTKSDLSGIYTELLVYMTLDNNTGSAELGDPHRADVVWTFENTTYNIECKSISNGFHRFGEPYRPHKFYDALAREIGQGPQQKRLMQGYIGAFLLNTRDLDAINPIETWGAAIFADARGEPWVQVPGLEKLGAINVYRAGFPRPDMVALSDNLNMEVFGNDRLKDINPACDLVVSEPNSRSKWRLMFFIGEDMDSMVKRAAKEFDKAMCQHSKRSNCVVFLRLEGLHGPAIPPPDVPLPDQTNLKLAAADRAIGLVYAAVTSSPHWADCLALIVNVPTPAHFRNGKALFGGRSELFAGPAATAPLPDALRTQF